MKQEMNIKVPVLSQEEINAALYERHTRAVQDKLAKARVAIAGLGGLGSNIAVMLTRIGIGHLHLIDFDRVDTTNLNRQFYTMYHLGMHKTEALYDELMEINPYLDYKTDCIRVTSENVMELFSNDTYICEAFDKPEAKEMLTDAFFEHFDGTDKYLISGSGMAGYESSNAIVTKKITSHFFVCGDQTSEVSPGHGLMAPRVSICAAHEANMIVRLILGEAQA